MYKIFSELLIKEWPQAENSNATKVKKTFEQMIWNINWAHTQTTNDGSETMKNTQGPTFSQ